MGKSTKNQRLRQKTLSDINHSKQTTLNNLPETQNNTPTKLVVPEQKKQIEITEINTSTREDELVLKVGFKLLPSKTAFSRVTSDLYFDEQKITSLQLRILQGPLGTDESEFSSVLTMTGISEGQHTLKVEMYESWLSNEKRTNTSKQITIKYAPLKKEDRMVKVPFVRSVVGADLAIVSDSEKNIYREMHQEIKREATSKRDEW
jgi:hypothetical protein